LKSPIPKSKREIPSGGHDRRDAALAKAKGAAMPAGRKSRSRPTQQYQHFAMFQICLNLKQIGSYCKMLVNNSIADIFLFVLNAIVCNY
jgi:hypothetical protein